MASEKLEVDVRPASDAAIDDFLLGEDNRFSTNQRHAFDTSGIGTGPENDRRQIAENDPNSPQFRDLPTEDYSPTADGSVQLPEPTWQDRFGNETNEKGKWRRTAEDAMSELARLKNELSMLRNTGPTQAAQPSPQPNSPTSTDYASMLPETFFSDKQPDDSVSVQEVNDVLRKTVGPAVLQLWHQQQQLIAQQIASQKRASGITPQLEQRITAEFPWIANIPDGEARVAAMSDIMRRTQQAGPIANTKPALVDPSQAAARRVTYIEGNKQVQSNDGEKTVQQRIAEEFRAAPTAADKRAVLLKYGAQQVNDFRDPSVLTR